MNKKCIKLGKYTAFEFFGTRNSGGKIPFLIRGTKKDFFSPLRGVIHFQRKKDIQIYSVDVTTEKEDSNKETSNKEETPDTEDKPIKLVKTFSRFLIKWLALFLLINYLTRKN